MYVFNTGIFAVPNTLLLRTPAFVMMGDVK